MRKIWVWYACDDELGESDAFYEEVDGKLKLITAWSNNDASYRDEYMNSLFKYLGIEVMDLPKKHEKQAKKLLKDFWGM